MLLLELPDEIVCHILEACAQLRDAKGRLGPSAPGRLDLQNFGLTCRKAHGLARPHLLRSCLIRRAKHVSTIASFLQQDPNDVRFSHVKDLALIPSVHETGPEYAKFTKFIQSFPTEHLFIEVPHHSPSTVSANRGLFEKFFKGLQSLDHAQSKIPGCPVPSWSHRLVTCHLNFQSPYGVLTNLTHLEFLVFAPRLRELTLRYAYINGFKLNRVQFSPPQHVSNLRRISLDYCSFSIRGISQLLSTPIALRSFSFYPHSICSHHDSTRSNVLGLLAHAVASLATYQRHSLTDLSIGFEGLSEVKDYESSVPLASHIYFNRLSRLTKLNVCLSGADRFRPDTLSILFSRLPSSITDLCFEDRHRATEFPWFTGFCHDLLRIAPLSKSPHPRSQVPMQVPLPNLTNLTIIFTPYHDPIGDPSQPHVSPDQASAFAEQGHLFRHRFRPIRARPIHLTVIRRTEITSAMPPYLWDEEQPEDLVVYDNMRPQDLWDTETDTETKRFSEMRRLRAEYLKRQEALLAQHQQQLNAANAAVGNAGVGTNASVVHNDSELHIEEGGNASQDANGGEGEIEAQNEEEAGDEQGHEEHAMDATSTPSIEAEKMVQAPDPVVQPTSEPVQQMPSAGPSQNLDSEAGHEISTIAAAAIIADMIFDESAAAVIPTMAQSPVQSQDQSQSHGSMMMQAPLASVDQDVTMETGG